MLGVGLATTGAGVGMSPATGSGRTLARFLARTDGVDCFFVAGSIGFTFARNSHHGGQAGRTHSGNADVSAAAAEIGRGPTDRTAGAGGGAHGVAASESFELGQHLGHRLRALFGRFGDHPPEQVVERGGNIGPASQQVRNRGFGVGDQLADERVSLVHHVAAEQAIQRAAQAVDVGPGIGPLGVQGLLGGHVVDRSHHFARRGQPVPLGIGRVEPGQAHVENLDRPPLVEQQVAGLDIAMDDPFGVGEGDAAGRLNRVVEGLSQRQPAPLFDQRRQIGPFDVLHHEEVRAGGFVRVKRGDDVRMDQAGGRFHLALKSLDSGFVLEGFCREHLQSHHPLHPPMLGLKNMAHAPRTDLAQDHIRIEHERRGAAQGELAGLKIGQAARADQHPRKWSPSVGRSSGRNFPQKACRSSPVIKPEATRRLANCSRLAGMARILRKSHCSPSCGQPH